MEQLEHLKEELAQKSALLENAKTQLKKEFFGIDEAIDQIIENVSSWLLLNQFQERPMVINLWGLTGVGKSALIERLTQLIKFNDLYYRFDLGEKNSNLSFSNELQELCENKEDSPIIITLDEFQHSRTIDSGGMGRKEIDEDKNRMVWELIDSGKIRYIDWIKGVWSLNKYIQKLTSLAEVGLETKGGKVTKGKKIFCQEMDIEYNANKDLLLVPEGYYAMILSYARSKYGLKLLSDVKKFMCKLDIEESLLLLKSIYRKSQKPAIKNFSKSLIFVIGNLDEAYHVNKEYSTEIDANDFHKITKKISLPEIKQALRERYRDEQVARLGNIHIIYPALNREAYHKIITHELEKFSNSLYAKLKVGFYFDQTVKEAIYLEGVYPTQGVRPLLTTINHHLKNKMSYFIHKIFKAEIQPDKLMFSIQDDLMICQFLSKGKLLFTSKQKLHFQIKQLRKNKKDEMQAITAVHESGHAILSALLLNLTPEYVYSVTSDHGNSGFTFIHMDRLITTRKNLPYIIAMRLGGIAAEELIFGAENLSSGAGSDILYATESAMDLLKKRGFGKTPINYAGGPSEAGNVYNDYKPVEQEAKALIEEGKALALETLQKERKLLLILSDYLLHNTCIKKAELKDIVQTHAKSDLNSGYSKYFFRDKLQNAVRSAMHEEEKEKEYYNRRLSLVSAKNRAS